MKSLCRDKRAKKEWCLLSAAYILHLANMILINLLTKCVNCEGHCLLLITYCLHLIQSLSWVHKVTSLLRTDLHVNRVLLRDTIIGCCLYCTLALRCISFACDLNRVPLQSFTLQRARWKFRRSLRFTPCLVGTITLRCVFISIVCGCHSFGLWVVVTCWAFISLYIYFQFFLVLYYDN